MKNITLFIVFVLFFSTFVKSETVTYENVVSKIYDLKELAKLPSHGEKGALFSSYERISKYDEKSDSYIDWYANADWAGVVRQEGENVVLADIKGPGVVWRIWSATLGDGKVKIYLDGKLAIDILWKDYFSKKIAPFNRDGLVYKVAGGWNNYTPISFQRSCKIVTKATIEQSKKFKVEPGVWGKFFHFNYSVFPKGTKVQTFKMQLSQKENEALDKANKILTSSLGENPVSYKNSSDEVVIWNIPAGETRFLNIAGKRAITSLKIKISETENIKDLLRQLTLSINWDKKKEPSVWAPLGDFFGTAPGINEYKSLVMGMVCKKNTSIKVEKQKNQKSFEFYSYWYMPFKNNAKISIKNESDKEQKISLTVEHAPFKIPFNNLGYFHAKWHRDLKQDKKQPLDWKILETIGRGRFVGAMLHIWNPKGQWWGEGDEKFYVDGEKFPSTFGTGSEDYFGYAWCSSEQFSSAYHSQTTNFHNRGHISNNRWHIGDNIPFQKSFSAFIEKYFKNSRPALYAGIAYWYLSENGIDKIKETPVKDRLGYYIGYKIYKEKDAFEAENLKIRKISKGKTEVQNLLDFGILWSGDNQFWWNNTESNAFIEFEINQPKKAEKRLVAQFTKAHDYAIIQIYFNDKKIGSPIDLYNYDVIASGKLDLGKVSIKKGKNILKIKIVGANPKAKKDYMVGIDYIKFDN